MTLTRMTAAMFELPFRVMELPFLMSAAMMDSVFYDGRRVAEQPVRRTPRRRGRARRAR
jgi:hypothetical protein